MKRLKIAVPVHLVFDIEVESEDKIQTLRRSNFIDPKIMILSNKISPSVLVTTKKGLDEVEYFIDKD